MASQTLLRDAAPAITRRAAPGRPDWATDGADWPNREASRFVTAGGIRWHVQIAGSGPTLLLLHGTGAATHSWRDMLTPLAAHFTVIAPDLPGHGFTAQPDRPGMTLPGMAVLVAALLKTLEITPDFTAGHSAGAAILAQMSLDNLLAPRNIIALNGAMLPLAMHGVAAPLIGPVAKFLAANPLIPYIFSWQAADDAVIKRLLASTGSVIDTAGEKFYARLARRPGHAGAALTMMAGWNLPVFTARLPNLKTPLILITAANDRSIPPADALRVQNLLPTTRVISLPALGHLAHEEDPGQLTKLITDLCQ
jgi:magnesium chelatase accessory protein